MSEAISGLDHLLIGVQDLEAARVRYQALGFAVTPRGRHIGWGTANYCIMFPEDYLELLGIVDASQFTNNLDRFLETEGEGLLGLAFAGEDLDDSAARLHAAGIAGDGPKDLKRILELPGGDVEPRFRLLHLPADATPGVKAFICRHLTPELVWQQPWLDHPNTARHVAGALVVDDDPEGSAAAYRRLFGEEAVTPVEAGVAIQTGRFRLRLARAEDLPAGERALLATARPGLRLMEVAVGDISAARRCLERSGFPVREAGGGIAVSAAEACGTALIFVPA